MGVGVGPLSKFQIIILKYHPENMPQISLIILNRFSVYNFENNINATSCSMLWSKITLSNFEAQII